MEESKKKEKPSKKPAKEKITKSGLFAKLLVVQQEVAYIQKLGQNKEQNYKFVREGEVLQRAREALAKQRVIAYAEVVSNDYTQRDTKAGKTATLARVSMILRYRDIETGEELAIGGSGTGGDYGAGDKAMYKAITGCVKYMFMKSLLIETGDDPENDEGGESLPASDSQQVASSITDDQRKQVAEIEKYLSEMPEDIAEWFRGRKYSRNGVVLLCKENGWAWEAIRDAQKMIKAALDKPVEVTK